MRSSQPARGPTSPRPFEPAERFENVAKIPAPETNAGLPAANTASAELDGGAAFPSMQHMSALPSYPQVAKAHPKAKDLAPILPKSKESATSYDDFLNFLYFK